MAWSLDEAVMEQLTTLWRLAPPGTPVREMTLPLGLAVNGAKGPVEARERGDIFLGDAHGAYLAALALKAMAGEVDVLLHAVGIVAALPHVLSIDEVVESLSLDQDSGGTSGVATTLRADLVTSDQVAEFTFIRWAEKKSNGTREVKLLRDLIKLDAIPDSVVGARRRVLYVTGGAPARRFLTGRTNIGKKLKEKAETLNLYRERHGDRFPLLNAYWGHLQSDGRVTLVDLNDEYPNFVSPDESLKMTA